MIKQNAGLLRRLGAMIYDAVLVIALWFLATIPFIAVRGGEPVEVGENTIYRITLAAVLFLFFTGYWSRAGRTLGMQSWRLRLETTDGERPSFAMASVRFFAAILSIAPAGLGFLWQLWDRDRLTWHDRLSKTRLVYYPKASAT